MIFRYSLPSCRKLRKLKKGVYITQFNLSKRPVIAARKLIIARLQIGRLSGVGVRAAHTPRRRRVVTSV